MVVHEQTTNQLKPNGRIEAHGLVKHYGDVKALDGFDLVVPRGHRARAPWPQRRRKDDGGLHPDHASRRRRWARHRRGSRSCTSPTEVRRRIGLSGQYAAVDENLTGYENLEMIGRLYHLGRKRAASRAGELLERFSLADAGNRQVKTYSGGMRRRLDLAGALVAEPPVLFLDEPTTGSTPEPQRAVGNHRGVGGPRPHRAV